MNSPPWSADTEEVTSGRRVGQVMAGKYRLLRPIGQGGMGEVYEAQHVVVGRRFAVKFLHAHLAQSNSALQRFRREAEAAGALENEHIAAVVDFDTADDGAPFLVMEYLVGESLGQLLQREGPLPLSRVVGALLQVCRGLAVAHAAGIIHRDLKPDNLFLTKRSDGSDFVKILDFGIAKLTRGEASDITRSGATLGTPFYMSPEQARGEKTVGEGADIYALGVIIYELLSGHKPHPGDSYNAILAHILSRPVIPLETQRTGLPPGFSALVERALSSKPGQRQASAAEFAKELAPFVSREVTAKHSQFELRAAAVGTATLPTPGAHTVPVRDDEPVQSPLAKPSAEPSAPRWRIPLVALAALAALLLLVAINALVGRWLSAGEPRNANHDSASASPSMQSPPAVSSPQVSASAAAASAPAAATESAHARQASAPLSVASPSPSMVRLERLAAPSLPPASQGSKAAASVASSKESSRASPPSSSSKPRVNFDEHNPY